MGAGPPFKGETGLPPGVNGVGRPENGVTGDEVLDLFPVIKMNSSVRKTCLSAIWTQAFEPTLTMN